MDNSTPVDTIRMLERVAKLEERVDGGFTYVEKELKEIKENHLQHLQKDVSELKIQVNTLAVKISIAVATATIIVDLVLRFFLR